MSVRVASLFPISTEGYDSSPNGRRADLFEVPVFLRDCGAPLFGLEEFLAVAIGRMASISQLTITLVEVLVGLEWWNWNDFLYVLFANEISYISKYHIFAYVHIYTDPKICT